jgi:regulator of sigma E protease
VQLIGEWLGNGWATVLVIMGLGLIIFIHEFGHFIMAKKNGVKVEIFSLGFAFMIPRMILWKRKWGETEYRICAFPFGGYVKMAGETLADERKGDPGELTSKTPWQRFQIFVAGAVMNLLIAFPIGILAYGVGKYEHSNEVGAPGVAETRGGMMPGDIVIEVDGRRIDSLDKFRIEMIRRPTGAVVPVTVMRGGREMKLQVTTMKSPYHMTSPATTMLVGVNAGSPLALQGIQEGDELVKIDGEPVSLGRKADGMLRERPNKEVVLEFRRRMQDFKDKEGIVKRIVFEPIEWHSIPQDDNLVECRIELVLPGMPAHDVLDPDDVIKSIDGKEIKSWQDLRDAVEPSCNKELEFEVLREKDHKTFKVKITPAYNTSTGLGGLGIGNKGTKVFANVKPGSYYEKAGLRSGDVLYSLAGVTGDVRVGAIFRREKASAREIRAPREGKVLKIPVAPGATVKANDVVAILDSMNTEVRVLAPRDGEIEAVLCKEGEGVALDRPLVVLKPLKVTLQVTRAGMDKDKKVDITLDLEKKFEADLDKVGFKTSQGIFTDSYPYRKRAFGDAVKAGLWEPVDLTVMTFDVLRKLITHEESAKGLSGPAGIAHAAFTFAKKSIGNFLWLLCLITVNLGVFNLLPIPLLDGGHNLLLLIEVVRKKLGKPPPSEKFVAGFQWAGLFFVAGLFIFVTFNDIARMLGHG